MRERMIGFVAHVLILLFFFLRMLDALFKLQGLLFYFEVVVFCGLIIGAITGVATYVRNKRYFPLRVVYGIGLLNIIGLSLFLQNFLWIAFVLALAGLGVSAYERQERARQALSDVLVTEIPTEKNKSSSKRRKK